MLIWKLFLAIPLSPGSDPLQPTKIKGVKQSCSNTWIQGRNHEVNAPFASVFDRMALIQKFKCVRMTFSKFADKLLKLAINKSKAEHVNVVFIVYCHDPIKNAKRGYCLVETLEFKEIIFPTPISPLSCLMGLIIKVDLFPSMRLAKILLLLETRSSM